VKTRATHPAPRTKFRAAPEDAPLERPAGASSAFAPAILAIVVAAALIRLVGIGKDLWLDEIWSVRVASELKSPLDALTLHHEINHYLNTIWLYFAGPARGAVVYHLPAYLAGVASVAVAALIGLRRSRTAGVTLALLFGASYELVLYSTEARGYSTAVLASLLSFYCLERCLSGDANWKWVAGYVASAVFGLLSHPIFVSVLAAGIAWTAVDRLRSSGIRWTVARDIVRIHGVPIAVLAVLYLMDLRLVVPGGGTPARSLIDAYGTSFAWTVGTLQGDAAALLSCVAAVIVMDMGLRRLAKDGSSEWVFFVVAIVFPIVPILVRGSTFVYTRHFLIGSVFLLVLVGLLLAHWWTEGKRLVCAVVLAAFGALNGWHILELGVRGRGEYRAAIRYMVAHTAGDVLVIGGDQDFRIGTELQYYLPSEVGAKRAEYVPHGSWPEHGPDWVVTQRESLDPVRPVPDHLTGPTGNEYTLMEVFPAAPLSGLHWYVYRNRSAP
jgi:hypothetical protein